MRLIRGVCNQISVILEKTYAHFSLMTHSLVTLFFSFDTYVQVFVLDIPLFRPKKPRFHHRRLGWIGQQHPMASLFNLQDRREKPTRVEDFVWNFPWVLVVSSLQKVMVVWLGFIGGYQSYWNLFIFIESFSCFIQICWNLLKNRSYGWKMYFPTEIVPFFEDMLIFPGVSLSLNVYIILQDAAVGLFEGIHLS